MKVLTALSGAGAVREVRSNGKCVEGKYFRFRFLYHPSDQFSVRIGIVVNKRQGTAVQRNLVRRRVREAFRFVMKARSAELGKLEMSFFVTPIYKGLKVIPFRQVPFKDLSRDVAAFVEKLQAL